MARLGAAADHRVRVSALDQPERVADGVRAGRAGGRDRRVRSLRAETNRDEPGGQVDDRRQDEEGRDAFGSALQQDAVLALDHLEPADAAADDHSDPRRVRRLDPQPALIHRHRRGGDRELDEARALLDVLLVEPAERIEPRHLAGEARRVPRRVEQRDRSDPGAPGDDTRPGVLGADRQGRHEPDTGDHNPPALARVRLRHYLLCITCGSIRRQPRTGRSVAPPSAVGSPVHQAHAEAAASDSAVRAGANERRPIVRNAMPARTHSTPAIQNAGS